MTEKELNSAAPAGGLLTAREAAELLGISEATVRNWAKLGKLSAASMSPLLFAKETVAALHRDLEKGQRLKSRRNKSRAAGNYIPLSYISSESDNHRVIRSLLEALAEETVTDLSVLFFYAKELLTSRSVPEKIRDELLAGLDLSSADHSCYSTELEFLTDYPLSYKESEDTLGMLYISMKKLREKKSTGSYYTPFFVADKLVDQLEDLEGRTVCDPGCGTGNFLIRLPDCVPMENIYGGDIDPIAIAIARINIALRFVPKTLKELDTIKRNITVRNFLSEESSGIQPDIYIGNPPWGYSFNQQESATLRKAYKTCPGTGRPESFCLFIEKAIKTLPGGGEFSFVLPESLLESGLHKPIRQLMLDEGCVTSLSYLGDVFDKVQCPGIILSVKKSSGDQRVCVSMNEKQRHALKEIRSFTVDHHRLSPVSFHLLSDDEEYAILEKIRSVPHFTLKGQADFALGIVTGNNKELLKPAPSGPQTISSADSKKQYEPIIKGSDVSAYHIKPAEHYIVFDPDHFQQCAPTALYRAKEKLFYRFIATGPVVARDCSGLLSLNSANIIVPRVEGYSVAYIMAILNSKVIRFYYQKTFRSLKVLRSSLESLPIPLCDKKTMAEIEALIYDIETGKSGENTEKMLDSKVLECYGISNDLKWRF